MHNLTGDKYIDYVDEVGIDEAEQSIKSYNAAAVLSTVLLIIFIMLLQLFTIFTARNEGFSQKQAIVTGAIPLVGPIYLMVKLAFLKAVSSISLFLTLVPCIVMYLYSMGVRRKRAFLHNAICMIAEKALIPEDIIQPNLFEFRTAKTENNKPVLGDSTIEMLDNMERLIISDVEYEEDVKVVSHTAAPVDSTPENAVKIPEKVSLENNNDIFVTTFEAAEKVEVRETANSKQDEVDRLINEILGGKK